MSEADAHAVNGVRRCITCHKDFAAGDAGIRPLPQFEAWGVCEECVESVQKTSAPKRGS